MADRPFAIVTGASTGIGFELATCCAEEGFDLLIAADEPEIYTARDKLRAHGVDVIAVETDLASGAGVDELCAKLPNRPVDALLANAGHGLGGAFLDQEMEDILHVVDTNITGTLDLVSRIGRRMRQRGSGRILITGSVAAYIPGSFHAVYNGTKAFLNSFSYALGNELKDSGVTVTCLMPGATETEFFARAHMLDTKVGQEKKDDPADVAKSGFKAMMSGEADVVAGLMNKVQTTIANVTPNEMLAEQHRKKAEPGSASKEG